MRGSLLLFLYLLTVLPLEGHFAFATEKPSIEPSPFVAKADQKKTWVFIPAWENQMTGFALDGYDPVSFFTNGKAKRGKSLYQFHWRGQDWLFANKGNKDVFLHSPQNFMPLFSGYDPVGLKDQLLLKGKPVLFTRFKNKIFLFLNHQNKQSFLNNPDQIAADAFKRWPDIAAHEGLLSSSQ